MRWVEQWNKIAIKRGLRTIYLGSFQWIALAIRVLNWYTLNLPLYALFIDFNLRSYRTDDYVPRLFFESSRANNFNESWIVKLSISCNNNSNPTLLLNRQISFQLVMKSRPNTSKDIHFMVTKAPGSDFQVSNFPWPLTWMTTQYVLFICRWTTSLISIVLPSTISRPPTLPYPYPARPRWTDWLHLAIFTSGSTSSKPIKRNEIIAIRADQLVIMVVVTVDGTNDSTFLKKTSSVCHFYFLTTDHNSLL